MKTVELTLMERRIIITALTDMIADFEKLSETEGEFMKEPLRIAIEDRKQIIEKLKSSI